MQENLHSAAYQEVYECRKRRKVSGAAGFLRQEADGATDVFYVVSAWVYVRGRELQLYKIPSTELALN